MERIKEKFLEHKKIKNAIKQLKNGKKLSFKGLIGSSKAFVTWSVYKNTTTPLLYVADNYMEAAYFYSDLKQIENEQNILFFPSSLRRSFLTEEVRGVDHTNLLLRTEVLNKIINENNVIIVSYPDAIIEKVIERESLEQNSLELKTGEQLSTEDLRDFFETYNFKETEFVTEPGEYSIRGGIVDIFSFSQETPYRIEFFGDEIESIRVFDVETQLSKEETDRAVIVPDLHTRAEEKRISLLDFVGNNIITIFNDLSLVNEFVKSHEAKEFELEDKYGEKQKIVYETHEDFKNSLPDKTIIEFGNLPVLASEEIKFDISPQPHFNKNYKLLAETLHSYQEQGYATYILSSNKKQLERLKEILQSSEVDTKVEFTGIQKAIHSGFTDNETRIAVYTDHQIFGRYHRYNLRDEKIREKKDHILVKDLNALKPGDYVVHVDHGIGVFVGMTTIENNGKRQEVIRLRYKDNDTLLVPIHALHKIAKYRGKDSAPPSINKLGSGAWQKLKKKAKDKVKDIAKDLIALYAQRMQEEGFAFSPDSYLQEELEASFEYEDTPDQAETTKAVKADMEKSVPMDRLVCGDVGFGKTEIAVRAAFKAVADNKQVALLCPTTVLTLQHYKTFKERLKDFPVNIDYLSRLKTAKQQKETLQKLAEGKIDIIIGTHRLISKDVKFKDLGLLIIDEEQKFGVSAKEKLRQLKVNVDTLTLTATPIPRTLQFSLLGARDLSILATPPTNRRPVITELHTFNSEIIRKAVCYELSRNGQVFFVHNHVATLEKIADYVREVCPEAKVITAHGKMKAGEIEKVMTGFINQEYDVLVTTTIIESGLDIPNANTIIINEAHKFGLSDLHQLRGRVGRSSRQAFCYLLAPPKNTLPQQSKRRLDTIEQFVELGSGFNIALQDLDIRGAGDLLGAEQSGFINEMGYETFKKILEEAVHELRTEEFKDLFKEKADNTEQKEKVKDFNFVTDCQITTDLQIQIPKNYVHDDSERLRLYHELNKLEKEEELKEFASQLRDRFGPLPDEVNDLLDIVRLRWLAMSLGIEKIVLKNSIMLAYFVSDKNSPFYDSPVFQSILTFISQRKDVEFKQKNNSLYMKFNGVSSINEAKKILEQIIENGKKLEK